VCVCDGYVCAVVVHALLDCTNAHHDRTTVVRDSDRLTVSNLIILLPTRCFSLVYKKMI
jgi:hypothetical protein